MARVRSARTRRAAYAALAAASAGAVGISALAPSAVVASSHREAPLIASDPTVDNTDTYAFVDPKDSGKVTLVANWQPFEFASGGPTFYKWANDAQYDINIDNNGDGNPDIVYRWQFFESRNPKGTFLYNKGPVTSLNDPDLLYQQKYSLKRIEPGSGKSVTLVKNVVSAPSNVGPASMPNYGRLRSQAVTNLANGGKTFAGQADDSFFLDLRVFDLLYGAKLNSAQTAPAETGVDSLAGFNVQTIALSVKKEDLAAKGDAKRNPVVGVWSTTNRRGFTIDGKTGAKVNQGPYVQVSRLGSPLVNELVVPYELKDKFNNSTPSGDSQFAGSIVNSHVATLLNAIFGTKIKETNRTDLVAAFATGFPKINELSINKDAVSKPATAEYLRLNMSLPYKLGSGPPSPLGAFRVKSDGTLGVGADGGDTGFPNGRRLTDDVVDIELQAIAGVLLPTSQGGTGGKPVSVLTDRVGSNDRPFTTSFPYVGLPQSGGGPVNGK